MINSGAGTHYQGTDPDLLHELTRLLERVGGDLGNHRAGSQQLLSELGLSPTPVLGVRLVEDWIAGAVADGRRRAAVATGGSVVGGQPDVSARPAPRLPVLVRTEVGNPVFEHDLLTGMGLSGYFVVGLSYHHLGVERRSVTRLFDYGDGWTETVVERQSRGVFEVNPGFGYGTFALATLGPHQLHDPWRKGAASSVYRHDGVTVTAAEFHAATRTDG